MSDLLDLDRHLPLIARGDTSAFAAWLAPAEAPLRASLRRFATQVDAEAVLQEALLRTWQVAPRVVSDGQPNALLRLAHRIARNLAISEARRRRELPEEDGPEQALAPSPPDPLLRVAIAACHEKLPPRPARAMRARIEAGGAEPDPAIARRIGMTPNTFLQNITRARTLLAECLRKRGVDLEAEMS